jgi:radical SAM protein with 4Fe4S-binding SPASM domain
MKDFVEITREKYYQADTEIVMFAGGEPTLRQDLVDIVRYTSTRMSAAMNTNGYACDESYCRALARAGLAQVKVSVDGMEKNHDWNRVAFENRYIVGDDEHCKGVCMDPNRSANFYDFCVGCISGLFSYCILATGKVVAGDIMTLEVGDLRTERMKDIWKNAEVFKTLRNRENLKGKCGKCVYRYVCGGCRRRAYAYTGDLMAADPGCWRND